MAGLGIVDEPKCSRDEAQCDARRELLRGPAMRALTAFVQEIRDEVLGWRCAGF